MIDLNKSQVFEEPIELEVSDDKKNWELEKINEIDSKLGFPFISYNHYSNKFYQFARFPKSKNIDKTKIDLSVNQELEEPVLMYVSNNGFQWEKQEINYINHSGFEFNLGPFRFVNKKDHTTKYAFKYAMIIPEEKKQEDEYMTRNEIMAFCIYNKVIMSYDGNEYYLPGFFKISGNEIKNYKFLRIKQNGELYGEPQRFLKKYLNQTLDGFNPSL